MIVWKGNDEHDNQERKCCQRGCVMNFEDLKSLYHGRLRENPRAYEEITDILVEARERFEADKLAENPGSDLGQAWRAWKGKNFEKLVHYVVSNMIENSGLPLKVVSGSSLERKLDDKKLGRVKRNVVVDFGDYGSFVPDADIVVYSPSDGKVIAIISYKITLREQIDQTGFWKLRLEEDCNTKHIKVLFVTLDEDNTLVSERTNKSKAIALSEFDSVYVLQKNIVQQPNLATLDRMVEELRKCL